MFTTDAPGVLAHAVGYVLETMCFSQALPVSETQTEEADVRTAVPFTGSISGCLKLHVSRPTAEWLAASFLGQDLTPNSPLAEQTVRELGNVICGRFLSQLDPSASLNIQPPVADTSKSDCADSAWHMFRADAGLLRIKFQFDSKVVH